MFLIIGYVIVIGSVLGGFMLENGNPLMLRQAITACLFKSMLNLSFFFAMVAQISRTILWNNLHKLIIIIALNTRIL